MDRCQAINKRRNDNFSEQRQNRIDEMEAASYSCHSESSDPTSLNTGKLSILMTFTKPILVSSSLSDIHSIRQKALCTVPPIPPTIALQLIPSTPVLVHSINT